MTTCFPARRRRIAAAIPDSPTSSSAPSIFGSFLDGPNSVRGAAGNPSTSNASSVGVICAFQMRAGYEPPVTRIPYPLDGVIDSTAHVPLRCWTGIGLPTQTTVVSWGT